MSFSIVRNDIAQVNADILIKEENHTPVVGAGVGSHNHLFVGPVLLEVNQCIDSITPHGILITAAFDLPAMFVIHVVTPQWEDGIGEELLLRKTYDWCLEFALQQGCQSIAFPLLAAGNPGFPQKAALETATDAFRDFLQTHDMDITLVVSDSGSFQLSCRQILNVAAFIAERMTEDTVYLASSPPCTFRSHIKENAPRPDDIAPSQRCPTPVEMGPTAAGLMLNLHELLQHRDAGFAETLVQLIERSGKKNSEIYKRANVDKKLFSKIINNVNYHPSKPTAVAFAIALELDLAQTRDLIGRAGFALTHSSKFDIIIEYFISQKNYDMFEINEILFSFDQELLGV